MNFGLHLHFPTVGWVIMLYCIKDYKKVLLYVYGGTEVPSIWIIMLSNSTNGSV